MHGQSQVHGVLGCGGVVVAENLDAYQPYGRGYFVAVLPQLVEVREPRLHEVHLDAFEDFQ